jgi:hypothetical protein
MPSKANRLCPTNVDIARSLGVEAVTIGVWRKLGMPNGTIAAAREWMEANKPVTAHRRTSTPTEDLKQPLVALPDEDPTEVVKRLRLAERTIAAGLTGWIDIALPEAIKERDEARPGKAQDEAERKITVIHYKIEALRKEQRAAVSALFKAEQDAVKLDRARGKLITIDEAKDLASKLLLPSIIAIRKLPDAATDENERNKFSAIAEMLLSGMREAATAALKSYADRFPV